MAIRNAVCKSTGERGRQGCRRQENSDPEPDLVSQIKETQQVGNPRSKSSFEDTEEESKSHQTGPAPSTGLCSSDDAPAKHHPGEPAMWRYDFPHESLPFKGDIGDVEPRGLVSAILHFSKSSSADVHVQEPLVVASLKFQILPHTSDPGIANIGTVQEGKHIEGRDQGHNAPIHLSDDDLLQYWIDLLVAYLRDDFGAMLFLFKVKGRGKLRVILNHIGGCRGV